MTGYARAERQLGARRIRLELKSVNGRGLDMRLRLPPGMDALDIPLRQLLSKHLARGSINLVVTADTSASGSAVRVNQDALEAVLAVMADLRQRIDATPPSLDGILALPGVMDVDAGAGDIDEDELSAAVLAAASEAVSSLRSARSQEGAQIAAVLLSQLDQVVSLVDAATALPSRSRDAFEARLAEQLAALKADATLSPERLSQEALLLATKADIQEELDRLRAHIVAARKLINDGGPVGRRLDFLAQEFNREANTLCSKSNTVELTAIGLDLKAVIDQLREQIQNIE
ncbi:MAG: YicC family protein [Phyllobacteriaceae bacterium]|nr:YicC family protein [Phyllobacteriaceae bacterium]